MKKLNVHLQALRDELAAALPFASKDEQRPALNAIHLERDGTGWIVVTTDGHRLRVAELSESACKALQAGTHADVNLSPSVIDMISGGRGDVLVLCDKAAALHDERVPYIDAIFCDWKRVVPGGPAGDSDTTFPKPERQTPLVRADLLARIGAYREAAKWTADDKRIAKMANKKLAKTGASVDGELLILDADGRTAVTWAGDVAVKPELSDEDRETCGQDGVYSWTSNRDFKRDNLTDQATNNRVGYNLAYILQALADTGAATILWTDAHSPSVICGSVALHVVMPMRLGVEDLKQTVDADALPKAA